MSVRGSYRNSGSIGRKHIRKSKKVVKKQPLFPKKVTSSQDKRKDEDYVNLESKHKLTYLRYPGSGKRPPPKPKRAAAAAQPRLEPVIRSPSPSLSTPRPIHFPHPPPRNKPNSPSPPQFHQPDKTHHPSPSLVKSLPRPLNPPTPIKFPPRPILPCPILPHPILPHPNKSPPIPTTNHIKSSLKQVVPTNGELLTKKSKQDSERGPHPLPRVKNLCPDPILNSDATSCHEKLEFGNRPELTFGSNGLITGAHPKNRNQPKSGGALTREPPKPVHPLTQPTIPSGGALTREPPKPVHPLTQPTIPSGGALTREPVHSLAQPTKPAKQPMFPPIAKPRKTVENGRKHDVCTTSSHQVGASPASPQRKPHPDPFPPNSEGNTPKAPLPKPRLKKLGENSHMDNFQADLPLSGRSQALASPICPIPRTRVGSRGTGQTGQATTASRGEGQEWVSISPTRPSPRNRPNKEIQRTDLTRLEGQFRYETDPLPNAIVPRKRVSKELHPGTNIHPSGGGGGGGTRGSKKQSLRTRRKGGGIRLPLWRAPPPPSWSPPATPPPWSPPATPTSKEPNQRKKTTPYPFSLLPQVSSPLGSPTSLMATITLSTSFTLPPFRSSDHGSLSPIPSDMNRPVELDQEPPILIAPSTKSPLKFEFEENLYENKTFSKMDLKHHLPLSIVQELQNNFRKQTRR